MFYWWFAVLLVLLQAGQVAVQGEQGEDEGVVEAYIEARDVVEDEMAEFLENAGDGALPDLHTQAMINLAVWREKLKKLDMPESNLLELLEGDPGLADKGTDVADQMASRKRAIILKEKWRWVGNIIPYGYTDTVGETHIIEIQRGIQTYERFTCMRFVPWEMDANGTTTNKKLGLKHPSHLNFVNRNGCWSFVGTIRRERGQDISCCAGTTCIHELGHMFGLAHEQQNPNPEVRKWIRVNMHYIREDGMNNYRQKSIHGYLWDGYDISSYMHYGPWAFSNKQGPVYTTLFPELRVRGSHYYMMKEISLAHKCQDECSDTALTCENDGYLTKVDGICTCMCIPGLDPASGCTKIYTADSESLDFPGGQYALPKPEGGCPKGTWLEGERTHYNKGGNKKSPLYPLDGDVSENKATHKFCVKDSEPNDFIWPGGNYCIYRRGSKCPTGFYEGFIQYDDEGTEPNAKSGELPDGEFNEDTRIEFCCRNSGFTWDELYLPSRQPFSLFAYSAKHGCQDVRGMHWSKFSHTIKNVGTIAEAGGDNPSLPAIIDNSFVTDLCSYRPAMIDCGGVIELSSSNPEASFESPSIDIDDKECYWLIKAPEGQKLALDFTDFDIKGSPGLCEDDLEVRYVRLGQPGYKYCGRSYEKTTLSVFNTIYIRLSTYMQSTSRFSATVRLIQDEDMCYTTKDAGFTYAGDVNFTRDFEPCVPWSEVTHCEYHPFTQTNLNTNLDGNNCRLPDQATGFMPWCFTSKDRCERNYCDVCQFGKLYDTLDGCENLKAAGKCPSEGCAKTCAGDFTQTSPITKAKDVSCPPPETLSDASPVDADKTTYAVGDAVTYKCNTYDETDQRWCLSTGQWSDLGFVCGECPHGWTKFGSKCYKKMGATVNFDLAGSLCTESSAASTIATPKTVEENTFLGTLTSGEPIWIGLGDKETESSFVWGDGEALTWANWMPSEPNGEMNDEDCVARMSDGTWNDLNCLGYKWDVVCAQPTLGEMECLDYTPKCVDWFNEAPSFCTDFPVFAAEQCRKTCVICGGDSPDLPTCSLEDLDESVKAVGDQDQISMGQAMRYECKEGFMKLSGDDVRGCDHTGSLVGTPLKCIKECPSDWIHNTENHYCFKKFDTRKNYQAAQDDCVALGGTLATIENAVENKFVDLIRSKWSMWIGLNDIEEEGTFKWADGSPLSYTYWKQNEPNNNGRHGEDCVQIVHKGYWQDISCSKPRAYACKVFANDL